MAEQPTGELDLMKHHVHRLTAGGVALVEFQRLTTEPQTWDEWLDQWAATGERYERLGDEAADRGRWVTAAQHWAAAASYYHFGQFLYYGDRDRKLAVTRRKFAAYRKAAPHLQPPAQLMAVPYAGSILYGYFRKPSGADGRVPCVLLIPGLEASKEELRTMEEIYLARGMATFSFDGPGQGESWSQLPMSERHAEAVSACLDHLTACPDVDARRLGIVGVSLGGLLAPLAAAQDKRLRCCAEVGGSFDIESRWERANMLSRRGYQWVTHAPDLEEARRRAAKLTMEPFAAQLTCPTLVLHGGQDKIVPVDQAYMFKEKCPNVDFVLIEEGNHVCHNIGHIARPLVADWVREHL